MPDEKKLIIDEGLEVASRGRKGGREVFARQAGDVEAANAIHGAPGESDDFEMPPASLEMLVSTLVTEAMIALGQIPHPATGKTEYRPNQAKYLIDTISVVSEKTRGNVSAEEEQAFTNLLHQLRMAFVALTTNAPIGPIAREP